MATMIDDNSSALSAEDNIGDIETTTKNSGGSRKTTTTKTSKVKVVKKRRRSKPKDYPKRPLSAYNVFFKHTREKILADDTEKTSFQDMVRKIASLWKEISPEEKEKFTVIASFDLKRYKEELGVYEQNLAANEEKSNQLQIIKENKTPAVQSSIFPISNVRIPYAPNDAITTQQYLPNTALSSSHTAHRLTFNELDLARQSLQQQEQRSSILRANDMFGGSAIVPTAEQLLKYQRNISGLFDARENQINVSSEAETIKRRLTLGLDTNESEETEYLAGLGGKLTSTYNVGGLTNRLEIDSNTRSILNSSEETGIQQRLNLGRDSASDEVRKQLGLNNLIEDSTSCAALGRVISDNEAELRKRLASIHNPSIHNQELNVEHRQLEILQKGISDFSPSIEGLSEASSSFNSSKERNLLQDSLLTQVGGGIGDFGRKLHQYDRLGAISTCSQGLPFSKIDTQMASIQSGLSSNLQRLTDEELRILLRGGRL